mmetsp:Transcript_19814/g.35252  ORF Transcript_19814/g.35252 Transcript_19814/m.35252 type:complete len:389 (+) Transcript_19814:64-1230(+)
MGNKFVRPLNDDDYSDDEFEDVEDSEEEDSLMYSSDIVRTKSHLVVKCSKGHTMSARMRKELALHHTCREMMCPVVGECEGCGDKLTITEVHYRCRTCGETLCLNCARLQRSIPMLLTPDDPYSIINLAGGDIIFAGPTAFGIHHVILVVGGLTLDMAMKAFLETDEAAQDMDFTPYDQVWHCNTIESTQNSAGINSWWYASRSYFKRDPISREARLIADWVDDDSIMNIAAKPIPFKILLHPLRREFGGPGLNEPIFQETVKERAEHSMKYGKATAVKAWLHQRLQQNFGIADRARPRDYNTPEAREKLMERYEKSWEKAPICASVAVKVWQKYFLNIHGGNKDAAALDIMKYMPCFCQAITPSQLTEVLASCGWQIVDNLEETAEL